MEKVREQRRAPSGRRALSIDEGPSTSVVHSPYYPVGADESPARRVAVAVGRSDNRQFPHLWRAMWTHGKLLQIGHFSPSGACPIQTLSRLDLVAMLALRFVDQGVRAGGGATSRADCREPVERGRRTTARRPQREHVSNLVRRGPGTGRLRGLPASRVPEQLHAGV